MLSPFVYTLINVQKDGDCMKLGKRCWIWVKYSFSFQLPQQQRSNLFVGIVLINWYARKCDSGAKAAKCWPSFKFCNEKPYRCRTQYECTEHLCVSDFSVSCTANNRIEIMETETRVKHKWDLKYEWMVEFDSNCNDTLRTYNSTQSSSVVLEGSIYKMDEFETYLPNHTIHSHFNICFFLGIMRFQSINCNKW